MTGRIWVTGATGYTGTFLLRFLVETVGLGGQVVGLGRAVPASGVPGVMYRPVDLTNPAAIRELGSTLRPELVFHLAGVAPPIPDGALWHVNVGGTVNLFMEVHAAGCRAVRFVVAGSAAEYLPGPGGLVDEDAPVGGQTPYGRSKWAQTTVSLQLGGGLGYPVSVLRPFNVLGPGLPERLVAGRICRQFKDADVERIEMGNIRPERDFIDVRDVARAYWMVAENGGDGEVYNVCSGTPTSIEALIEVFFASGGYRKPVAAQRSSVRGVDPQRVYATGRKLRSLGWEPEYELERSVADMLKVDAGAW